MLSWVNWLWKKPMTIDMIVLYCRSNESSLEEKMYLVQHVSDRMFEQLKRPERKQELMTIAEFFSRSIKKTCPLETQPTPLPTQ